MSSIDRPFRYSRRSGGSVRNSWYVSFLCLYSSHNSACTTLQKCQSTGPSRTLKNVFRGPVCTHQRHQDVLEHGAVLSRGRSTMGVVMSTTTLTKRAYW